MHVAELNLRASPLIGAARHVLPVCEQDFHPNSQLHRGYTVSRNTAVHVSYDPCTGHETPIVRQSYGVSSAIMLATRSGVCCGGRKFASTGLKFKLDGAEIKQCIHRKYSYIMPNTPRYRIASRQATSTRDMYIVMSCSKATSRSFPSKYVASGLRTPGLKSDDSNWAGSQVTKLCCIRLAMSSSSVLRAQLSAQQEAAVPAL